ncbi:MULTISPECIES: hypothetical protein [Streptomyces]|uniref:hypothetical protein n=1 Tax=Streptomyces TaxID=1883 RepID=UPI0005196800|nr:hypothetical protein [Streptomyces rimosus]
MTIQPDQLTHPAVRAFVAAVNANDQAAFRDVLTPGATMSDDGTECDISQWSQREIFSSNGHMDVTSEADEGLSLVVDYRNDTWGTMRTKWHFTVDGEQVARFETGQA